MEENFVQQLKSKNLSLTAVRMAVLQSLAYKPHSNASSIFEMVKKQIPTATLQAIYNNLNTLVASGIIREIKPKGCVSLYETRVGDNHHHIVCRSCGNIADTECNLNSAPCLSSHHDHDYIIDEAEIIFWGTCPSCQTSQKKEFKNDTNNEK